MRISTRILAGALCAGACALASAAQYELSLNAERRGGDFSIAPSVEGPPGARLRYEIEARRQGRSSGRSQQGGQVVLGRDGSATLSQMSFSVGAQDRCEVTVKLYEGKRLVASESTDCN